MSLSSNLGSTFAAKYGSVQSYTSGAAIYRGATVVIRLGDGLLYPAADDTTDTNKQLVVGYAMEAAAAAGVTVRVRQDGKLRRSITGSPAVVIGRLACVKDDDTIQLYGAGSCKVVVGRITEVISANEVYVDFTDRPVRLATGTYD